MSIDGTMKQSKINKVFNYMLEHDGITQLDAYKLCMATRLSGIIFDLKKRGVPINTEYLYDNNGTRYAKYSLTDEYKKEFNL